MRSRGDYRPGASIIAIGTPLAKFRRRRSGQSRIEITATAPFPQDGCLLSPTGAEKSRSAERASITVNSPQPGKTLVES